ncbi:MAG: hypothetical protein FJZ16_09150, partial [Candidatus Omnitrophica bacterium]|nr:hypothetical protein [Candidatus Omnitrophota bacterium]
MKRILIFLIITFVFTQLEIHTEGVVFRPLSGLFLTGFTSYVYAYEEEEVERLKNELRQLQLQFEQMKTSYDGKIKEMQIKIEELEKERVTPIAQQPTPLAGMGKPALELPDISVIGDVVGTYGDDKTDSDRNRIILKETELALQGYLYPDVRADIIAALHRHSDDGEYKAELEEGYISFLKTPIPNLSLKAGKKLLDFGKLNPRHSHHWNFVDRPEVLKSYFGDHGLAGQGANFSYLVPLPFFLQWDLGAWHVDSEHTHTGDILGLAEETYSTRLWSSFDLAENQELELGLSGIKGYGAHHSEHKDKVKVGGVDLTYRFLGEELKRLIFQNEFLFLDRDVPVGDLNRWGCYSLLN